MKIRLKARGILVPKFMIDPNLEDKLIRFGIEYQTLPSDRVPNNSGTLIMIKDYKPEYCSTPKLSFILSAYNFGWENKCWIPKPECNIKSINTHAPSYHPQYGEIIEQDIKYHPYSINFGGYDFNNIDALCYTLYPHIVW